MDTIIVVRKGGERRYEINITSGQRLSAYIVLFKR